jgi:glycosyltransferase involved in cell wall biosynthesis
MLTLALILTITIGLLIVGQIAGVAGYISVSSRFTCKVFDDSELPSAAIILSLRGCDPFLGECLQRLIAQDYPRFSVHIVVDNASDPAYHFVKEWAATHPDVPIEIELLEDISPDAYLKTNAVRQCISHLSREVDFAVLVDADTLTHQRWLRDTIAPMIQTDTGVITGNRWYDPTRKAWGSLVRCIYNMLSVGPMYFMKATWGGALGIRRDVFDQQFFFDSMRKTPSEDQAIQAAARNVSADLVVQPNIMILNSEECSLRSCFMFIRRQLIWTRLYHPNWSLLVAGVLMVYAVFTAAFFGIIVAAIGQQPLPAILLAGALFLQIIVAQMNLEWLHWIVSRRMTAAGCQPFPTIGWRSRIRLLCVWPLAFLVLCWAIVSATRCQSVQWRGITYAIVPPRGIRMLEYRPFQAEGSALPSSDVSLG